jgi:hypothetical protein
VVVDECFLRVCDGLFNCVKLLCEFNTVTTTLNHRNRATQMAFRTLQAKNNAGMRFVLFSLVHVCEYPIPLDRIYEHVAATQSKGDSGSQPQLNR